MADPLSIIGLITGVITFIDFGSKIALTSKELRDSQNGMTFEVEELDVIIENVRAMNQAIHSQKPGHQFSTKIGIQISKMIELSETVYKELRDKIDGLRARPEARFKLWEHFRVGLRYLTSYNDLQGLKERLLTLSHQIGSAIKITLQTDGLSGGAQSSLTQFASEYNTKLEETRKNILETVRTIQENGNTHIADQAAQLMSLKMKLDRFVDEETKVSKHKEILKSLYFRELPNRGEMVMNANEQTNRWLYDDNQTCFASWLQSRERDDSTYYIYGKAGSGKSTLMKYIYQNKLTHDILETWAGTSKLYVGQYYFWSQGTELEKSRKGLMQSLLYQVLRSAPELSISVYKERMAHETWTLDELTTVFKQVFIETQDNAKFCFFIDGLDEFSGEENEVAPMLAVLIAYSHVKLCASSRPDRMYESSLRHDARTINIAHLTMQDIQQFVRKSLYSSEKIAKFPEWERECQMIVSQISEAAQGVWLWVYLVTRDILKEADRYESINTLQRVINGLPSGLEEYFERMIERIDIRHRQEMAQIFLMIIHQDDPLPLYAFEIFEREQMDSNYAHQLPIRPILDEEIQPRFFEWKARVKTRCGDLVVVGDRTCQLALFSHPIGFLHKSVLDFLQDCYYDQLKELSRDDFNPFPYLCKIYLAMAKGLLDGDQRIGHLPHLDKLHLLEEVTGSFLYYAYLWEQQVNRGDETELTSLLEAFEKVHDSHIHTAVVRCRTSQVPAGNFFHPLSYFPCSVHFLEVAAQAGLIRYACARLASEPERIQKMGLPILYDALPGQSRPGWWYDKIRPGVSTNIHNEIIEKLLTHGADPNALVHHRCSVLDEECWSTSKEPGYDPDLERQNHDSCYSVWSIFLVWLCETYEYAAGDRDGVVGRKRYLSCYRICEAFIRAGAQSNPRIETGTTEAYKRFIESSTECNPQLDKDIFPTASDFFRYAFGMEEAAKLEELFETVQRGKLTTHEGRDELQLVAQEEKVKYHHWYMIWFLGVACGEMVLIFFFVSGLPFSNLFYSFG